MKSKIVGSVKEIQVDRIQIKEETIYQVREETATHDGIESLLLNNAAKLLCINSSRIIPYLRL